MAKKATTRIKTRRVIKQNFSDSVAASASNNTVTFGKHRAKYYRTFKGKRFSFIAVKPLLKDAKKLAAQRNKNTSYDHEIVKVGAKYIIYTGHY